MKHGHHKIPMKTKSLPLTAAAVLAGFAAGYLTARTGDKQDVTGKTYSGSQRAPLPSSPLPSGASAGTDSPLLWMAV